MKAEIRKKYIEIRKNIKNKKEKSEKIINTLLSSEFYKNSVGVMIYISTDDEVNTRPLIDKIIADGKMLFAPKCIENHEMEAVRFFNESDLVPDKFGILAPKECKVCTTCCYDLIIVPGVAFNENLHRIGYGGGYYDRFLNNTDNVTCGLFFDEQRAEFSAENHDMPLDYIITDTKIYEKR